MFSRLRPLNVRLVFRDRVYRLGETISIVIELDARCDVVIREARVDLVCDQRWTDVSTVMVPETAGFAGTEFREPTWSTANLRVPRQVTREHRESYVPCSAQFIDDARFDSGTTGSFGIKLEIPAELPPHAGKANMTWGLVAAVDVVRARDVSTWQAVNVVLG